MSEVTVTSVIDKLDLDLPRPNYSKMSNDDIYDKLHERKIIVPRDDKGVLIRKHAVHALMEWDDMNAEVYRRDPKVRIVIHNPGGTAMEYAFLGLNGASYQVPYETEVELPSSVVRTLDDAIEYQYTMQKNDRTGGFDQVVKPKRALNYSFLGVVEEKKEGKSAK